MINNASNSRDLCIRSARQDSESQAKESSSASSISQNKVHPLTDKQNKALYPNQEPSSLSIRSTASMAYDCSPSYEIFKADDDRSQIEN
jgi:hypothetical protein